MSIGSGIISADSAFEALAKCFAKDASLEERHVELTSRKSSLTEDPVWSWRFTDSAPDIRDQGVEPREFDEITRRATPGEYQKISRGVVLETERGWLVECENLGEDDETLVEYALSNLAMLSQ